ncbi:MAG: DUF4115 domain-containing protein [Moraxellaceae bacterium]|nr:DUF4115 domain-containing protein [Moraxellaceae bacterium]
MSDDLLQTPAPEEASGSVWRLLREAREARGLSISEVAQHLKFTPKQVEAMEAGALDSLPGAAFARGFVRNYARFLQLDPQVFLASMGAAPTSFEGIPAQPPALAPMPRIRNLDRSSLRAMLISLSLLALVAAGWYFGWLEARDDQLLAEGDIPTAEVLEAAPESIAPAVSEPLSAESTPAADVSAPLAASAPVATQSAPVEQNLPATQSAPAVMQSAPLAQSAPRPLAAVSGQKRVQLSFRGESWVEVRDADGNVLLSRLNAAGSSQEVQGRPPIALVIGNAREVSVSVEGKAFDLQPHIKTDVARINIE